MGKFVVISGLPASGKSTLIKALKEKHNIVIVPEHNEWVNNNFPKKPENKQEKIEKQKFFLNIDIARYNWAMDHLSKADVVLSDTDFTSPLAHNYAERWIEGAFDIYAELVEEYGYYLKAGKLGLPDKYIYLDASLDERLCRRKEDFENTERKRNDLFFTPPFPQNMRHFYYQMMNEASERKSLPAVWYDNCKSKEEALVDLWKIICEEEKSTDCKNMTDELIKSLRLSVEDKQVF
ncbi:MAG: AAA family ATPase [Alphaproteobacteria bacterium]|nr:AAA family ATPase [Alphaproteobacteria bacterium]